MQVHLSD
nr:NADH-plastoquinone oxidoreductase subunit J [Limodorum abortivum]